MLIRERLPQYALLMRWDKPIGVLLLLWPTLWALWLAGSGEPNLKILIVFCTGVFLMRSAGCVVNDFADRNIDLGVKRTQHRPLATGNVDPKEALIIIGLLSLLAFLLVLNCNFLTVLLAFAGAFITLVYPLMKRFTHLPQLGLGIAFAWGVPMAFAAEKNALNVYTWFLFLTSAIWPIIYDTMYAMVDRSDDMKIGVKSTAILFNTMDKLIIGLLQILFLVMLIIVGLMFHLHSAYYTCLSFVGILFVYQQWLIKDRNPDKCFQAFLNNNYVGFAIFVGIMSSYLQ